MSSITLKNVPEPLLKALRALARQERRSLNQQVLSLLEHALGERSERESGRLDQIAAWKHLAGQWRGHEGLDDLIAEIYRGRTAGRQVEL